MKNKLLLIAACIFLFASCSDMRYAGMQKVKHHPTSVVETKNNPAKKYSPEKIQPIDEVQSEEPLVWNQTPAPVQIENNNIEQAPENTASPKIAKITKKIFPKKIAEKTQKDESQITERKSLENKKTVKESKIQKGSWLWYVVVGLVLILIGGIFAGSIGYIFWLVGIILVIYGLLVLLEVL